MYRTKLLLIALFALCNVFTLTIKAQSDGKASYYSNGLHGRRMSNGERYDRNAFTCAHRTLPFGTRLKITNPRNGKSVIVRVTDRGPFVRGRVVDLSYAAARELGTIASGVAYVKVELVRKETEIPFPSESTGIIEIPEIEYGTAGVCYEFIPEWEKVEEDKPKEIERKVDTRLIITKLHSRLRQKKITRRITPTHTSRCRLLLLLISRQPRLSHRQHLFARLQQRPIDSRLYNRISQPHNLLHQRMSQVVAGATSSNVSRMV